ncbi:MAG TPA: transposase [Tahibacter sp.]|nr:transposase [Tahibacter sp.]
MTLARLHTVDPATPGAYHVVSRCVRQAWLCGRDAQTGQDYSHRKRWIEERIHELADQFSIAIYAYVVMDNHIHLVVQTNPRQPATWSAESVVRRWASVSRRRFQSESELDQWVELQRENSSRVDEYRSRLGSLSWFMRLLNEPIARRANAEDHRKGRFWEGRFRCQALLDEAAILSAMAYVDLNPVRAGIVKAPEAARHVSIRRRCQNSKRQRKSTNALQPIAGSGPDRLVSEREYLKLVDATGRRLRKGKDGAIDRSLVPIVQRLGLSEAAWVAQVRGTESSYWRVIGCFEAFLDKTAEIGQRWLKGSGFARRLKALL